MTAVARYKHQFVTSAPRDLSPGVLYVSLEYCTMLHLCACGCERKVVTPISPNDWSMTFNGKTVTVHPSIGSWSIPCQSHYLITRGKVIWAGQWSDDQIKKGREADLNRKRSKPVETLAAPVNVPTTPEPDPINQTWSLRLFNWITRLLL